MTYLIRHFIYRGLVKWYDRSLQNFWWEFDSLIPCLIGVRNLEFTRLLAFFVCEKTKSVIITERKSRSNILHV